MHMGKSIKKMSVKEYIEWIKNRKSLTTLDKKLGVRANKKSKNNLK